MPLLVWGSIQLDTHHPCGCFLRPTNPPLFLATTLHLGSILRSDSRVAKREPRLRPVLVYVRLSPSPYPEPEPTSKQCASCKTANGHACSPCMRVRGLQVTQCVSIRSACGRRAHVRGLISHRISRGSGNAQRAAATRARHSHGQGKGPIHGASAPRIGAVAHHPTVRR